MEFLKLEATFDNFNKVIEFYTKELGKPERKVLDLLARMGSKNQILSNPDGSVTVTWYFRSFSKYDKFTNAFLNFIIAPSCFIPQSRKTYEDIINS